MVVTGAGRVEGFVFLLACLYIVPLVQNLIPFAVRISKLRHDISHSVTFSSSNLEPCVFVTHVGFWLKLGVVVSK